MKDSLGKGPKGIGEAYEQIQDRRMSDGAQGRREALSLPCWWWAFSATDDVPSETVADRYSGPLRLRNGASVKKIIFYNNNIFFYYYYLFFNSKKKIEEIVLIAFLVPKSVGAFLNLQIGTSSSGDPQGFDGSFLAFLGFGFFGFVVLNFSFLFLSLFFFFFFWMREGG